MIIRLQSYSYRFAEQVLNSKLSVKREIEAVILEAGEDLPSLTRPVFNEKLDNLFVAKSWQRQPAVFGDADEPAAKMDFLKERIGIEVEFGHSSFIGIDLLKFQVSSYSGLDKIDVGLYVVTTKKFQKVMKKTYGNNWDGSLNYEKVIKYLPYFKSAIQVPIYVIGIDL